MCYVVQFSMFFNIFYMDLHNETCGSLASLRQSINTKWNKKDDLVMVIGSAGLLVLRLNTHLLVNHDHC